MNQAPHVVQQDTRDAPRDAGVSLTKGRPDRILVAPINSISYTCLEEPLEANAADLYVSAAACVFPHPSVANYPTVDLALLKEMAQALANLFGLMLPVS